MAIRAVALLVSVLLCLTGLRLIRQFLPPADDVYLPLAGCRPTQAPLSAEQMDALLDLNAATREELMALPGIGEKTADAIIALRAHLGRFRYKEDLLLVHGIGEKKLDAIYELIYIH